MVSNQWETIRPMHQKELDRTLVVEFAITSASAKIRDEGVIHEPEDYRLGRCGAYKTGCQIPDF